MVRFIERNGIKLAFREAGSRSAAEAIVIIHGWADRHELFAPMQKHFQDRYRVIAVDLRGHGQSDKPKQGYEISTLADDVMAICERQRLPRFHLIGHSLGGMVGLEMAARYADRVRSVSAIEGGILFPRDVRQGLQSMSPSLRGPEWKTTMREFIDTCFWPTDGPSLRRYSYGELDRLPQHVHVGVHDAVMAWDAERAARAWKKPFLYIEGGMGLADLPRLKTLCPQLIIGNAVGLSHMEIVAQPAQSVAMIDRFLKIYAKTAAK